MPDAPAPGTLLFKHMSSWRSKRFFCCGHVSEVKQTWKEVVWVCPHLFTPPSWLHSAKGFVGQWRNHFLLRLMHKWAQVLRQRWRWAEKKDNCVGQEKIMTLELSCALLCAGCSLRCCQYISTPKHHIHLDDAELVMAPKKKKKT